MKLISVKTIGKDFRSLTANHIYKFNISDRDTRLSTKCFAGLNGSGKSNMLELLSEIFYFLDYYHLIHGNKIQKQGKGFGFEIEYLLPLEDTNINHLYGGLTKKTKWMHVKIQKPLDDEDNIEFSIKPRDEDNSTYRTVSEDTHLLLPKNIIAYTSGQNELLSNPFYKLKYHYFREVVKRGGNHESSDRMFFIDDANNFNIFLANFLIGDEQKLELIKGVSNIIGLNSFRITINLQDYKNKDISLLNETTEIIKKLKSCSTCWDTQKVFDSKKKTQLVLDFLVNENTIDAFKFHFENSAMNLFKSLYKLEMLNLHMHSKKVKELINDAPKWLNVSDEIPDIDPNNQIFRIEKIMIDKILDRENLIQINYKNLSDGEHQFNEVIGSIMLIDEPGCLLLMDEPDTHFNPKWRAKLIWLLNQMAAINYDSKGNIKKVIDQEVIITTHSPFAISDSYTDDVYVFDRGEKGIEFKNPDIKTYGASFGIILENIFGRDKSISDLADSDLEVIKTQTRSKGQIISAKENLFKFGESIEKFDAISYLFEKEDEMDIRAKKRAKKK